LCTQLVVANKLAFVYADITADTSLKMKDTVDAIIKMLGVPRNYGVFTFLVICGFVLCVTSSGADQQTLLHLYKSLIRSKLDYGCIVYGSARGSYLQMLDPIQNHALRLCLGAYRTSLSSSLRILTNEPPVYIRRRKLSIQYPLRLSSSPQNPTYNTVFICKFKDLFERKPNQIPPLSIRVQPDLRAVGFVKRNALIYSIPATRPWLLNQPHINYNMHRSFKDNTSSEICRNKFFWVLWPLQRFLSVVNWWL